MPTPQTPKTEMISFRGTPKLKNMLDRISKRENLSRSDFIREMLGRVLPTPTEVETHDPDV